MLRVLVWKELLEHLRSLRFAVSFATIVGLFVLGAWVWNLRIAEERQGLGLSVEEYEGSIQEHAKELGRLALLPLHLWMPTADLTFASGGYSRSLPNVAVTVPVTLNDDEHLSGFERRADRNPLLFRLDPDWVFIAGMLGTLMALLLTYDGVAGEKERGCLRQLLANRVPRDQVLIAKYLAGLAMSAAPILTGAVAAVAVIQLLGKGLPGDGWPALAGVVIAALLCVSAFLWLGLWTSSRTHNSALALLASLVVWALLAVFLPQAGVLAGDHLVEVPSLTQAQEDIGDAWNSEGLGYEERIRAKQRAQRHYWNLLLLQIEVARNAALVSPVAALSLAAEALTVTGVDRYRAFVEQTHEYRQDLERFVRRKGDEGTDSAHGLPLGPGAGEPKEGLRFLSSTMPVRPEEVPRFQFRPPGLRERLDAALAPLLVLVIANGVCFLGAYFSFRRYDVR